MPVRIEAHAEPIPGYTLLDRLGAGGFGEVWRAEAPGGIFKAIKIIHGDLRSRDNDLVRYAEQELKALKRVKQVRHPYLLALDRYDIVDGRLMITMELADCNLWDRFRACRDRGLPGIPRDELLGYMAEIAEVLDLFDDRFQLQHLDIKPQNLFLLHHHVKVADFGQVKDLEGLVAEVTGGITPVYAAPETFDGLVTRYCDQYSLACVYQELLTGTRPFDGGSMSQLLMQHLNLPPNLGPSPPGDRPALTRALAKRPEDRWPNVTAFVRTLAGAGPGWSPAGVPHPPATFAPESLVPPTDRMPPPPPPVEDVTDTPPPRAVTETTAPVCTPAPPETTGPGPVRPALVLGVGQAGLRVLQRLRFDLSERYGPPDATPAVRLLYVDTDPDDLADAARPRPADRLAGLAPDEVFPARLNRAAHYLKPRLNGRALTEGWFDPQLLYKLPRVPRTMGLRLFGRLAFCDHFRTLTGKIEVELAAAVAEEALARTEARTGLDRRTNRPQVYVVAGLGGGTGGGAFLDAAYAVRARLRRMGYEHPEVVGVLVVPPADPAVTPPQALGNAYAALTELNHYSRPDTTFAAGYDDRNGAVRDSAPPFTRCYLVPGPAVVPAASAGPGSATPVSISTPGRPGSGLRSKPTSRVPAAPAPRPPAGPPDFRPYADAAELIRLNLFTPVGRAADEHLTAAEEESGVTLSTFGLAGFGWPRGEVVAGAAAAVARAVLRRWAAPDVRRARDVVPGLARQRWAELGLNPDAVLGRLRSAADAGGSVEDEIARAADPLAPGRGWLSRLPDPDRVAAALARVADLLGPPASSAKRPPTAVEAAVGRAAAAAGAAFAADVRALAPVLVDDPQFRLAGAEEVLRQCLATTDRLIEDHLRAAAEADAAARDGFECASRYAHSEKGVRRPTAAEFGEAVRTYPRARLRAVLGRGLVAVYQAVRDALTGQLTDVAAARQRLDAAAALPVPRVDPGDGSRLLPPGCASVGEAVDKFLAVLGDADLAEVDRRAQEAVGGAAEGVFQACLNAAGGAEAVAAAVYEGARAHLDRRLGAVDFAAMFAGKYPTARHAERAVEQAYLGAEPGWVGGGPWAAAEVTVLGCPPEGPLRELARRAVAARNLATADTPDELVVYREWPVVPLAALPQLGPAPAAAYRDLPAAQQCSAHARLDVTAWRSVDEG